MRLVSPPADRSQPYPPNRLTEELGPSEGRPISTSDGGGRTPAVRLERGGIRHDLILGRRPCDTGWLGVRIWDEVVLVLSDRRRRRRIGTVSSSFSSEIGFGGSRWDWEPFRHRPRLATSVRASLDLSTIPPTFSTCRARGVKRSGPAVFSGVPPRLRLSQERDASGADLGDRSLAEDPASGRGIAFSCVIVLFHA